MSASQCLPSSAAGTCTLLPTLSTPLPLTPVSSLPSNCTLLTPLFLLGLFLLLSSLCLSHFLSYPIQSLGQLGPRGRRNYAWNESTHGAGGRFIDWWLFGGSLYIRAGLFCRDSICSLLGFHGGSDEKEDNGGENLFACFGVAHHDDNKSNGVDKQKHGNHDNHIGIIGYDSSLGAHGPVVLAPIRASLFILAWCSFSTFLIQTHSELAYWLMHSTDSKLMEFLPLAARENSVAMALYTLRGIQSILSVDGAMFSDSPFVGLITNTIIYALSCVTMLEIGIYIVGISLNITGIYVPKGVSHPGGPRPHKIVRVPKWTEGKLHVMPKDLLTNQKDGSWRCAVAHDAHRDTIAKFNQTKVNGDSSDTAKASLTGEPFGRQIWTTLKSQPRVGNVESEDDLNTTLRKEFAHEQPTSHDAKEETPNLFKQIGDFFNPNANSPTRPTPSKSKQSTQSELVQLLASGGRPSLVFDPSKNVNSCDQIFRAQMISAYLEENGKLPNEMSHLEQGDGPTKRVPAKTVMEAARRGIAFYSMLQSPDGHWAG